MSELAGRRGAETHRTDVSLRPSNERFSLTPPGNVLNGSDQVRGFTLASLLKLSQTKDVSKTTTVLEYLVAFLHKKLPVLLEFHEELKSLTRGVKGVSLALLWKQVGGGGGEGGRLIGWLTRRRRR